MEYAKVNGDKVLVYPYFWVNLLEENPNTAYDDRFDLAGWYEQTEDAIKNRNILVLVETELPPEIDLRTHRISLNELPTLENGKWVIKYTVTAKTEEEIALTDKQQEEFLKEVDLLVTKPPTNQD